MVLRCNAECKEIKKKSKSPAFDGIEVGDVICFSTAIEAAGRASKGTYATYIHCYNTRTKKVSDLSFNQINRVLESFEFLELERPLLSTEWED